MKALALLPIRLYRWFLSPFLGRHCRFHPTCSTYALEAIETHGICRGYWLVLKRVGRCHPLGGSGYDPVPEAPHA
jgi:putative membrane protein insertion efficiency factor